MNVQTTPRAAARLATAAAIVITTLAVFAGTTASAAPSAPSTDKVVAFHQAMDKLWQDHVAWTRNVIVSFAANSPDLKPALARLLRNQTDIGDAIKPYYGAAAGNKLTSLLRTHIMEAVPVLTAAKSGDKPSLKKALAAWYANGHQIAAFLSNANPKNWPAAATKTMMNDHLALTTNEAVARLNGAWKQDIVAYDAVQEEILMMSDTLADGIIRQFPSRFA
jgi:hypothetical protein